MSMLRPRSLQLQLALRLGLLFFVATALAVGALLVQTYGITSSMSEQNLIVRANELARAVSEGGEGAPVFTLPARLATSYDAPAEVAIFAIRDAAGNVIAASGAPIRALAATWPVAHD